MPYADIADLPASVRSHLPPRADHEVVAHKFARSEFGRP